jgi:outer membrane protein assembly factor BamB
MGNQFQAIDWKKGAIAWTFQAEERPEAFYSSAALAGGLVVVGSRDRRVHALDRTTGKEVWSALTRGRVDSSPVVVGKRAYVGSLDGKLYVLDLAGGREVQKIALDGPVSGSPAVASGRLLIGTQKGTLYCFGARK